ncbi:UDP-N-acetylmuramate--L-alanine ligase [Patescibacteria group bacterium]|nr:UDP-N-acetylmuramate--L-alanine ligase [Patescibacteria group bacterium]
MTKGNFKHIHFVGIGGSGISAVAQIAQKYGYKVTGCDIEGDTAYLAQVKKEIRSIYIGHSKDHLDDVDLVVVSPSIFFQGDASDEIKVARKKKILLTWQEFLGKYLHKGKKVICVAGTHGKSTTAAMVTFVLQSAKRKPSAIIGANVNKWNQNFLLGDGDLFVTEADEFFDNFLNYSPEAIILNNIEFDHPDYFSSYKQLIESFKKFVSRLKGKKILIVNQDSEGIKNLMDSLDKKLVSSIELAGYTLSPSPKLKLKKSFRGEILVKSKSYTTFFVESKYFELKDKFKINLTGEHNVANSLGVVVLSKFYGIKIGNLKKTLSTFTGVGRRMQLIGEKMGVKVLDDYAHHPTAIRETLSALGQMYPGNRLWAVVEPHSYSRTKSLLKEYKGVFKKADFVIIAPIYKARDKKTFGVTGQSIVKILKHKNSIYLDSFAEIVSFLKTRLKKGDVILVMGAGKSYQLARLIFASL